MRRDPCQFLALVPSRRMHTDKSQRDETSGVGFRFGPAASKTAPVSVVRCLLPSVGAPRLFLRRRPHRATEAA
ncbi:MAG: hypothetical protein IVW36_08095 [Dehalococcoidia bacterium]|nr:hypothetical protein [Dehalococcoidia bacterium]